MKKTGANFKRTNFAINPMFQLTKEEHLKIINPTHISLSRFRDGIANATDWYNLAFRTYSGVCMARLNDYATEVVDELSKIHDLLLEIEKQSAETGHKDWLMTVEEINEVNAAIDATDELQYAYTRLGVYKSTLLAKAYMKKFV